MRKNNHTHDVKVMQYSREFMTGNVQDLPLVIQVGDRIKCLVIDYVFPRNVAELVMTERVDKAASMEKKKKKDKQEVRHLSPAV